MFDLIQNLYTQYSEYTSSNQMLGAVVAGLLMGSIGIMFRTIPKKIFNIFYARFVFSIEFNSSVDWEDKQACRKIALWAKDNKTFLSSKKTVPTFDSDNNDKFNISIGLGKNLIRYKNKFYLVDFSMEKSDHTLDFNYTVKISCFGKNQIFLEKVLFDLLCKEDNVGICIKELEDRSWREIYIPKRPLSSVITTDNVLNSIYNYICDFENAEDWYKKTGISYKTGIMLYGPPGTGKTSLIKALATELNKTLYSINLNSVGDKGFESAVRDIKSGSILALEDIDCVGGFNSRQIYSDEEESIVIDSEKKTSTSKSNISLSTILNVLDGINPLHDIVIIMTTNHIDKIDPAILRKGRSDLLVEIKLLDSVAVNKYSQLIYGKSIEFNGEIKGCDIQSIVLNNKTNYDGFVQDLNNFHTETSNNLSTIKM